MMKSVVVTLTLSLFLAACGPSDFERQKQAFEEKKYNDEQAAKAAAAQQEAADKLEQTNQWNACRALSQREYNSDFSNWGEATPGKPGHREGPANQLEDIRNRLQRQNEECDRNFPKGISY